MDTFVKKTLKVSTHILSLSGCKTKKANKNVSTLSKTDGLIRCATYNMAGKLCQQPGDRNAKAPDLRTGIVLKSGAKVRRYFESYLLPDWCHSSR